MLRRLRNRQEWKFFGVLFRADVRLALFWWLLIALRGVLPALFAVATGVLVATVVHRESLLLPLAATGSILVLLQILVPVHQAISSNLGDRAAAWLYDRLTEASVRPPGLAHLDDAEITSDLIAARDFDLGNTGPPLATSMDFIAGGLVTLVSGVAFAAVLLAHSWWAPALLAGAWLATHWLLRESAIWKGRNTADVRAARRDADYAYRLAVEPHAGKELRLFRLGLWVVSRFAARRKDLHSLLYDETRLRERPVLVSLSVVLAANGVVFAWFAQAAQQGSIDLGHMVTFAQAAVGTSMIAFGGLNWALDGSAAPVAAALRIEASMQSRGSLSVGSTMADELPANEIRFRDVTFAYPGGRPVLNHFDLVIPAGSSLAIVGQNGAGKTTLAKLLCRLYDPQFGTIEIDGIPLPELDVDSWRSRVTAVFQDFIRYELSLHSNVAPSGAPDAVVREALDLAGVWWLTDLNAILARGYDGGTDLSGGQWQRVALARALCAVRQGASVVVLDEPTAQLDVRSEATIFDRVLRTTRQCTTILISHRISTVRHADRICVLEGGRVAELGTHEELMSLGGRYRAMFDLQARRFYTTEDEEGRIHGVLS